MKTRLMYQAIFAFALAFGEAVAADKPFNRVIIGVDASGSYSGRQVEAISKAKGLLDEVAKRLVKRWEQPDEIIVISIDAIPDVIWRGTTKNLQSADSEVWQAHFLGRGDYALCTDVGAFFRLVAGEFAVKVKNSAPTEKYLFVFSDLIDEPPLGSPSQCKRQVSAFETAKDLPWEALKDVSISVFWMPIAQKLAWAKVIQEKGLVSQVNFYSESESAGKLLVPPKPAKRKISDQQKAETAEAIGAAFTTLIWMLFGIVGAIISALGALALIVRARRANRGLGTPRSGPARPLAATRPQPARPQGSR